MWSSPPGCPWYAGESGICSGCGVATLSISYEELGRITGEMAVQDPHRRARTCPSWQSSTHTAVTKMYNAANCEALGITRCPTAISPLS